jgi:hypothetical protein
MFSFVVRILGFLKAVPLLPQLFDSWLKIWLFLTNHKLAVYLDEIESEVSSWKGVSLQMHKYGGTQFNLCGREIGHIHGNGLLDVLFDRATRDQLLQEGRITHHHVFKNSGWISFYVRTRADKEYALRLLDRAYKKSSLK